MTNHCETPSPGVNLRRPGRLMFWRDFLLTVEIAVEAFQRALTPRLDEITRKIDNLGVRMSALDDALAALDTATTDVATKVAAQTQSISDLTAALAAAQPGSDEAAALQQQINDAVTAINAESDKLHGLAADPANPVPDAPVDTPPADPAPVEDAPAPADGS